jgi:carboxylesterase
MRYLGEQLHGAGYTVIGPRLKGHGISPAAMARTTAADWIDSVDEALAELRKTCSQIYMTGLSMGGTLTLFTAASHADVIKGAIPINAAVHLANPDMAGLAFGRGLPDTVPGIGSDIKDPNTKELAYAEVPVAAFRQVYALMAATHDLLPRVKCPTLVITAREDHVVSPSNGPLIAGGVGANRVELVWLENSYHVATIDHDKALIARLTIDFIKSIAGR